MAYNLKPLEAENNFLKRVRNKFIRDFIDAPKRKVLRKKLIAHLPDYSAIPSNGFSIHSLLCHADVEMGICTFKTFNYLAKGNFEFIIHDDGTLTSNDINYISTHIKARIYSRTESDKIAAEKLKAYPNILKYRQAHFLALKLIDVKMLSSGVRIAYLDSDILFFHHPDFYLETFMSQITAQNFFNKDLLNAYIDAPEKIAEQLGVAPYPNLNAGLWVCNAEDISLEKLESWLSQEYLQPFFNSYRLEQTLVSLLAVAAPTMPAYFPEEYDVDLFKLPENTVGKHYVGKIRHGYELEGIRYLLKNYFEN